MIRDMIFGSVGGLALFIYGMGLMSDGLKKAAGQKLKQILESMTGNPLMGFSMGMLATALVQSSSATTVMIIGLVNAGLMTLKQAICVIFGTNVGTTATAWIVSLTGLEFKIAQYVLLLIAAGVLLEILSKGQRRKSVGQVLIGFGILFLGIEFMMDAFSVLKNNPAVSEWLGSMAGRPLVSLLAGTVITVLVQSSSASILIIQSLAGSGAFGEVWQNALDVAIPFVLGANIGTTVTAQLASLRTNLGSRRTAWAHTMFNVIGAAIALPFVYFGLYGRLVMYVSPWDLNGGTIMGVIAIAHTMFNVLNSILFLPFAGVLERFVTFMVRPRKGEIVERPVVLEKHLLDTPVLALDQARREMVRMAGEAKRAVEFACQGLAEDDVKKTEHTRKIEDIIDNYQYEITTYLVALSQRNLDDKVSTELPVLLHTVNDLERIGDHAINIAEIADRKISQKLIFSEQAVDDSSVMLSEAYAMFDHVLLVLAKGDVQSAHHALACENRLNQMQVSYRRAHVQRMTDGVCSAESGIIFIDLVDNVEKIGDHLTNIAQAALGGIQWDGMDSSTLSGQFRAMGRKPKPRQ